MIDPQATAAPRDPDLINAEISLRRAALRTREKAWCHGVLVVYPEDGVISTSIRKRRMNRETCMLRHGVGHYADHSPLRRTRDTAPRCHACGRRSAPRVPVAGTMIKPLRHKGCLATRDAQIAAEVDAVRDRRFDQVSGK